LHHFSIFNVILEEFKFSKVFWTRSTFNALILQSWFFVESMLILLSLKNKKNKKNQNLQKKKREKRKEKEKLRDQFGNLAILLL